MLNFGVDGRPSASSSHATDGAALRPYAQIGLTPPTEQLTSREQYNNNNPQPWDRVEETQARVMATPSRAQGGNAR